MSNKIIQCCYTNASTEIAGKVSSGWQTVAVSSDISSNAYHKCTELQSVNSTIEHAMVDEDGDILNLYEIAGDGNYAYILRTQYGLLDRLGRANMFSHAYILSWNENGVISDPNSFLTIANENFKSDIENAEKIQEELIRTEQMNIKDAMNAAGLDVDSYVVLIQCVYMQATEQKIREPLYIQYDGTEDQMKAILYCIYYALPYYLRKMLHIASATANKPSDKNVIFSRHAEQYTYYFLPKTGENNILTPRIIKKLERYGFVDYVAKNIKKENIDVHFTNMETMMNAIGGVSASNELIAKISHQILINNNYESFNECELEERLSDTLRAKVYGNQLMESYITSMIKQVYERNLVLSNENEEYLAGYLSNSKNSKFLAVGEQYNIYRFSSLPESEAAKKLALMSKCIFETYRNQLSTSQKGSKILDYYYSEICLSKDDVTWEELKMVYTESKSLPIRTKTTEKLTYLAFELYSNELHNKKENNRTDIRTVYKNYILFMEKILDTDSMRKCIQSAKEAFWETVEFSNVSYDFFSLYKEMDIDNEKCRQVFELLELEKTLRTSNEKVFLNKIIEVYGKIISKCSRSEIEAVENKFARMIRINYMGKDRFFGDWCKLITKASSAELARSVLFIRDTLNVKKYGEFIEEYQFLKKEAQYERVYDSLIPPMYKLLCEILEKEDKKSEEGVPLDVWLCIANNMHNNSFEIFDIIKTKVLQKDSVDVVEKSVFLQKEGFISQAEQYIHHKGTEAKTVKKWLSDVKRQKAKKDGFFNHGFSVLSKLTQNEVKDDVKETTKDAKQTKEVEKTKPESKGMLKGLFKNK